MSKAPDDEARACLHFLCNVAGLVSARRRQLLHDAGGAPCMSEVVWNFQLKSCCRMPLPGRE